MNSETYHPEEINLLHDVCEDILTKIQTGVYPPFPEIVQREAIEDDFLLAKDHPLLDRKASKIVDGSLPTTLRKEQLDKQMQETGMKLD